MKKNYQELQINVISLNNADVITSSSANLAERVNISSFFGASYDIGDFGHQDFS